jgi:serine/threonine-protein kinase
VAIASDSFVIDGRYEVGEVLGRGGMGEVRRARDLRLDRDVAIKFLRPDLAAQPDARDRFEDEARNAARLTHPNVVLVLDSGEHDGTPYLVMECLPGRTLKDELQDGGPLAPARATWITRDVLAGLAAAHDIGIVHRDVSPRNILLTDTGRAKLADFGIAKAAEAPSVTVVGQVLGTPAYVAPERLRGEPATTASDVYGIGATLYEALSGAPPFRGDSAIAIAHQAVTTRPERLEHLRPDAPLDLVAAIDHAMDPDPARRPSAEELRASLAGDVDLAAETSAVPVVGETEAFGMETSAIGAVGPMATIAAPVVAPVERVRRGWRERRTLLATAAIAAVAGLLLLAASDHAGGPERPTRAETPSTSPTTVAPPVTAAQVVVRSPITAAPKPDPRPHHGKHGKD